MTLYKRFYRISCVWVHLPMVISYFYQHSKVLFHDILVWPVPLAQVLPCPQLIFPFKTWFFGIDLNFQQQKSLKNRDLPHFESKSYQINSIKSSSSRSFQHTKGTFQFLWSFQLWFNLIFNEEIIQYSRTFGPQVQTSWNQAHAPFLVESFPKTLRTQSEASRFGGSHN